MRSVLVGLLSVVCLSLVAPAVTAAPPDPEHIKFLKAEWAKRRSEVVNGRVVARTYGRVDVKPLTPAEFRKLVAEADARPGQDAGLLKLIRAISAVDLGETPWSVHTTTFEGDKVKEVDSSSDGRVVDINLRNGTSAVSRSGVNKLVTVDPQEKAARHLTNLNDLRYVPADSIAGLISSVVAVRPNLELLTVGPIPVGKPGGRQYQITEILMVDPLTADVLDFQQDSDGSCMCVNLYRGFADQPSGVRIPSSTFSADFRHGRLLQCRLYLIDKAKFNTSLSADAFAVPVSAGDTLVDNRPVYSGAVLNATAAADVFSILTVDAQKLPEPTTRRRVWLVVGVCGLLVLGLLAMGYRYSRRRRVAG